MATAGTIELIPKEVEAVKERARSARRIQFFAILFFVISAAAGGLLFYYQQIQAQDLETVQNEAARHEATIADFSDIETKIVGLQDRTTAIPQIFAKREYFSTALVAVEISRPSGVDVTGMTIKRNDSEVTINGESKSYSSLASFLDNLISPQRG
ncbi:MAG: hypothetical protein Q8P12_00835, partial [bacterium]|nr:hypothetical protein [bacterium]